MAKRKQFLTEIARAGHKGGNENSNYHFTVNMNEAEYFPCRDFIDRYGTSQKELWRRLILFFAALPMPVKELIMRAGNLASPGFERPFADFLRGWADRIEKEGVRDIPEMGILLPKGYNPADRIRENAENSENAENADSQKP